MKNQSRASILSAVLFNAVIAFLLFAATGIPFLVSVAIVFVAAVFLGWVKQKNPQHFTGMALDGLLKEIWISRLMEKFYPAWDFITRSVDMSEFVDNNTINLAEAGIDPDVLINNTTYPIEIAERDDTALDLPLDYFDTVNTVVRNAEQKQLAYSKIDSVIRGHKNALLLKTRSKALHAWAPSADATYTPVISTTGAARTDGSAYKQITIADLAKMKKKFDMIDAPAEGRICVLHPNHAEEIFSADTSLFKVFTNLKSGEVLPVAGWDIYNSRITPVWDYSTGAKRTFGATAGAHDADSSIFYVESEVMRADGGVDMFSRLADPEARGDIIGFQKRFVGLSIRSKYTGAIFAYHA